MNKKFLRVKEMAKKYDLFSESSLRWHIQHADENGLSAAIKRIGRTIFIDEELFITWLNSKLK